MGLELLAAGMVVASDRGLLQRSVHPFDLAVGPSVIGLCEAMLDAVLDADAVEHVHPVTGCRSRTVLWGVAELDAIVGEHGVDPVRDGPRQGPGGSRRQS